MQLGVLNLLLSNATATAASPPGGEGGGSQGASHDRFSQLLGEQGAQGGKGGQGGALGADLPTNAVLAQDMNLEQLASLQSMDSNTLLQLLTTQVGPEQAATLVDKISAMHLGHGGADADVWNQLKDALENIKASGEPRQVADILKSLPEKTNTDASDDACSPMLQRMLQWLQTALEKRKEASTQVDADSDAAAQVAVDANALSLQASVFRTDDAKDAQAIKDAVKAKEKASEVTTIVPLSLTQSQPQPMPAWVKKLGQPDASLDQAIPPLALDGDDALPPVQLPQVELASAKEPKAVPQFLEQLKPLTALKDDDAVHAPITAVDATDNTQLLHPTPTLHTAHTSYTANATTSANVLAHVAVTEQVHMAISRAKDEGVNSITLQLEPAELGRVEVKMNTGSDGRTHISFLVDKPDTLQALSRDARSLERSLQEAGIKSDAGSMEFNLRQQPQPQLAHGDMGGQSQSQHTPVDDEDEHASLGGAPVATAVTRNLTLNFGSGVDIHA